MRMYRRLNPTSAVRGLTMNTTQRTTLRLRQHTGSYNASFVSIDKVSDLERNEDAIDASNSYRAKETPKNHPTLPSNSPCGRQRASTGRLTHAPRTTSKSSIDPCLVRLQYSLRSARISRPQFVRFATVEPLTTDYLLMRGAIRKEVTWLKMGSPKVVANECFQRSSTAHRLIHKLSAGNTRRPFS